MAEETRNIYMQTTAGAWFRATIPADARVTFGPLIPGRQDGYGGRTNGLYLRVYKTKDVQYGVFPNIVQFRDESLILAAPVSSQGYVEITEADLVGDGVVAELKDKNQSPANDCPNCDSSNIVLERRGNNRCDDCGWTF